jgi:hypothetical protein
MQRHVLVDGKVRTDKTYPAGFMGMHTFNLEYQTLLLKFRVTVIIALNIWTALSIFQYYYSTFPAD